jgi:hypothetical protein
MDLILLKVDELFSLVNFSCKLKHFLTQEIDFFLVGKNHKVMLHRSLTRKFVHKQSKNQAMLM